MDPSNIANLVVDLSIRYSFQVLAALAILAAGFVCARIVGRFVERSLRKTSLEKHLQQLLVRAAKIVVVLFTAILALDKFGVQITALVAGLSVAGLAGGLALQGVLGNIAAGLRCSTKCIGRFWSVFASGISRSRARYGRSGCGRQRREPGRGTDDSRYCSKEHGFPGFGPVTAFFAFRPPGTCL